jgi:arsenite-transporting ATPase
MKRYLMKQILFFGGKGGVGKTTLSSAFALRAAKEGKRTLLVSTDPAHNLHDIFGQQMSGEPSKLLDNLWAMEIDPKYESRRYIDQVKANLSKAIGGRMLHEIERQVDFAQLSPGSDEAALFDRMVEIIGWAETDYDMIVFDTAPTGHTLRLLSLPELMGVWIDGMLQRRQKAMSMRETWLEDAAPNEDPIYEILTRRKLKFAKAREVLLNPKQTAFSFVLTPERLPILETAKAIPILEKYKIPVEILIVNRVLPDLADGEFLRKRKQQEKAYLTEIESQFHPRRILKIPMLDQDVCGLDSLRAIAAELW